MHQLISFYSAWPVFSYKLRYIVGFTLVEMAISTNVKPTIYRNLYENTGPASTEDWVQRTKLRGATVQCWLNDGPLSERWHNINPLLSEQCWLMLDQRRRRWASLKPTLLQRLVPAVIGSSLCERCGIFVCEYSWRVRCDYDVIIERWGLVINISSINGANGSFPFWCLVF